MLPWNRAAGDEIERQIGQAKSRRGAGGNRQIHRYRGRVGLAHDRDRALIAAWRQHRAVYGHGDGSGDGAGEGRERYPRRVCGRGVAGVAWPRDLERLSDRRGTAGRLAEHQLRRAGGEQRAAYNVADRE